MDPAVSFGAQVLQGLSPSAPSAATLRTARIRSIRIRCATHSPAGQRPTLISSELRGNGRDTCKAAVHPGRSGRVGFCSEFSTTLAPVAPFSGSRRRRYQAGSGPSFAHMPWIPCATPKHGGGAARSSGPRKRGGRGARPRLRYRGGAGDAPWSSFGALRGLAGGCALGTPGHNGSRDQVAFGSSTSRPRTSSALSASEAWVLAAMEADRRGVHHSRSGEVDWVPASDRELLPVQLHPRQARRCGIRAWETLCIERPLADQILAAQLAKSAKTFHG